MEKRKSWLTYVEKKEEIVKCSGENKVIINFPREKEVLVKFLVEKKVMVKSFGGKEAMLIDETPFPLAASINITATDSRAMINAKKVERFSPSARVRKVWIPRQYLTYKNDLVARERVSVTKKWKKNGRYPYHSVEDSK